LGGREASHLCASKRKPDIVHTKEKAFGVKAGFEICWNGKEWKRKLRPLKKTTFGQGGP